MNDAPRQALCQLVARYGLDVTGDVKRCEGLIRDLCPDSRREANVLILALKERVPADLLGSSGGVPKGALLARLSKRLDDNLGLDKEFAKWAVESWALALGVLSAKDASAAADGTADRTQAVAPDRFDPRHIIIPQFDSIQREWSALVHMLYRTRPRPSVDDAIHAIEGVIATSESTDAPLYDKDGRWLSRYPGDFGNDALRMRDAFVAVHKTGERKCDRCGTQAPAYDDGLCGGCHGSVDHEIEMGLCTLKQNWSAFKTASKDTQDAFHATLPISTIGGFFTLLRLLVETAPQQVPFRASVLCHTRGYLRYMEPALLTDTLIKIDRLLTRLESEDDVWLVAADAEARAKVLRGLLNEARMSLEADPRRDENIEALAFQRNGKPPVLVFRAKRIGQASADSSPASAVDDRKENTRETHCLRCREAIRSKGMCAGCSNWVYWKAHEPMPSHWCRAEGRLGAKVARPASDLVGCEAVETKTPDALCEWCRNGGEDDSKSIDVRQRELDRATVTAAGMSQADSSTAESLEPKAESHNAAVSSIAPARPAPKVVVCVHCGRETLRSLRTCHRCHKSLPRDEEPLLGWHDIPRGAYDKGQLSTHPDMPSEAREGDDGNPVGRGRGVRIGLWILFVLLGAVAVWMAINLRAKPDISERQSAGSEATVAPSGDTRSTAGMEAPKTVAVPAGMFWMGCNERVDTECYDNEKPGRKVSVAAFEIDRTEVTVAAYRKCVTAGACSSAEPSTDGRGTVQGCNWNSGRENHPVNCVDWSQASAYCKWAGGRLPTEAEWEKAARGTDGRKYPWGNTDVRKSRAYGNVHLNASGDLRETMPVGSYPAGASPYGALDMIGNVTEWVESKSRTYPGQKGEFHRLKGDSWYGMASASRPSYISEYDETRVPFIGFRCARTPRS